MQSRPATSIGTPDKNPIEFAPLRLWILALSSVDDSIFLVPRQSQTQVRAA